VFSVGTALLLLARIPSSQAAEIQIVSPSAYEYIEGPEGGAGGTTPFRFQQVFPAADFAALGNQPHWLVAYTFRPDQTLTSPRTVQFPDNEVRLSTTQRGPDDLSERFDDNLGPDVMQFYRGLVILATDIDGASPVPREFYHAEFPAGVTPFLYDPTQGNLLFDVIGWEGISPSTFNDRVPGIQTTRYASDPSATDGEWIPAVMVHFTFIPVPELSNPAWSGGQFQFTLTGETNVNYVMQASTNLQSWTPLTTNSSPNASRNITINAPNSRSFYRAVIGP
jgi:hypothetical protein